MISFYLRNLKSTIHFDVEKTFKLIVLFRETGKDVQRCSFAHCAM